MFATPDLLAGSWTPGLGGYGTLGVCKRSGHESLLQSKHGYRAARVDVRLQGT